MNQLCQITKPNFLFDLITIITTTTIIIIIIILCFPPIYCQFSLQPQVLSYKMLYVNCVQIFFICLFLV